MMIKIFLLCHQEEVYEMQKFYLEILPQEQKGREKN